MRAWREVQSARSLLHDGQLLFISVGRAMVDLDDMPLRSEANNLERSLNGNLRYSVFLSGEGR